MKQLFQNTRIGFVRWRLAIVRALLFSFVTLGAAWQTATATIDVGKLSRWELISLLIGIFVLWGNQMIAFLDKTTSRMEAGKTPIATGNTDIIRRQIENG